ETSMNPSTIPQPHVALTGGRIILPDRAVSGHAVIIAGGRIAGVVEASTLSDGVETIDVGGRYIAPGLIDIHTHGALGHTFNEPTAEAFAVITAANVARGVTSLLATIA